MLLSSKKCLRFGYIYFSLKNKTELFIDHVIDKKMDVCVVTETWMNDNNSVTTTPLSLQGYTFRYVPRESDRSGGGLFQLLALAEAPLYKNLHPYKAG